MGLEDEPARREVTDDVRADETLYRRVPRNSDRTVYYTRAGARLQVLPEAFLMRIVPAGERFAGDYGLSVDQASLRGFNPELTRQATTQGDPTAFGVLPMPAKEVRTVAGVSYIAADPRPDNPAHAQIGVIRDPRLSNSANKRVVREVERSLADLANQRPWLLEPSDPSLRLLPRRPRPPSIGAGTTLPQSRQNNTNLARDVA